jgi:hypothetical protein
MWKYIPFHREAVTTQSPGLPLRLPWVRWSTVLATAKPLRRVDLHPAWRNRIAVENFVSSRFPGLKQPWALVRDRFAVNSNQLKSLNN